MRWLPIAAALIGVRLFVAPSAAPAQEDLPGRWEGVMERAWILYRVGGASGVVTGAE